MKKVKKVIICFLALFYVWSFCFMTDTLLARIGNRPIFSQFIGVTKTKDANVYIGVFYKVYIVKTHATKKEWYDEEGRLKDEYYSKAILIKGIVTPWDTDSQVAIQMVKEEHFRSCEE